MTEVKPYRIIVTSSRDWVDVVSVAWHLGAAVGDGLATGRPVVVVHGDCPTGGDAHADRLARRHGIAVERHPAKWSEFGNAAGPRRNLEMVSLGADILLAFLLPCRDKRCPERGQHDSHGAGGCMSLAKATGIPVREIRP